MSRAGICLCVAVCLGIPACGSVIRQSPPMAVYDLGPVAEAFVPQGEWPALALEVRSPVWLDSSGIDFRLAYDDPLRRRQYASSRWLASPRQLLAQRLREQLGLQGVIAGVAAACMLRVELQEFSHAFDSPQASRGTLQAQLLVIGAKRQVLAGRRFLAEHHAATPDARGGVAALVAASDSLGNQIKDWLGAEARRGSLRDCRSGGA